MKAKNSTRMKTGVFIMAALFLCAAADAVSAQPPNDNFADAIQLSGMSGQTAGTNIDAKEESSLNIIILARTVWYSWTAPETGAFYFDISSNDFNPTLDIESAKDGGLTRIAYGYGNDNGNSRVAFRVETGTLCYIAVYGGNYSSGNFVLNWGRANPPANDNFTDAIELTGVSGQTTGTNIDATPEFGEDTNGYQKSVWYSWTAPEPGAFYFDSYGSDFDTFLYLAVYTGSRVNSLTRIVVASGTENGNSSLVFRAETGIRYYIAVSDHSSGSIVLNWRKANSPANDDFADALELTGISGQIEVPNEEATKEPFEPDHTGKGLEDSVWYSWTAPESDIFYFSANWFAAVYAGLTLDSLTRITDSIFYAQTGTRYHIALVGGYIVLNWNKVIPRTSGQFEMELRGRAFADGARIAGSGCSVLAFGPGGVADCRGKAAFINYGTEWYYNLTVVSDSDGEEITFKVADSKISKLYHIDDTVIFKAGTSLNKDLDKPLKADSVYPALGETGKSLDVTVSGFGFDENTKVLMYPDIGNTKAIIGSVAAPGDAYRAVVVSGTTAYVVEANKGSLWIIDIKNPANPQIIASLNTPGDAYDIAVSGTTAYVADRESGLQIIDVSNPAKPQIISSVDTPGNAQGIAVFGTTAYVADGYSGLQIIDIKDPVNPEIIRSVDTPGYAQGITVSGNGTIVYVADIYSLQIIDVSDPAKPQIIGSVDTDAQDVAVSGTTAYVAGFYSGLQIVDVSDPTNPQTMGSTDTPGYGSGIAVSGTTAYLADGESGYLHIIDVSDPANPQIIASVATTGEAADVAVSGTTAYVADFYGGLQIIDVSDPARFQMIINGLIDTPGSASDVAVSGTTAYVADGESGLQIISVSDPAKPQIIGSVDTPGGACDIAVSGTTAYLADRYSGLKIIDISTPSNPQITGSVDIPGIAQGVAVSGTIAYVASGGEWSGLKIITVDDPANPQIIGSINMPSEACDVTVSGTTAYVADYDSGLQIIDVSNPATPQIIGSLDTWGVAVGIAVSDTTAYVADDYGGLQIIAVTDPAKPRIIGSVDTPHGASAVAVSGTTVFVGYSSNGLQIIDMSDPTEPRIIASAGMPSSSGIAVSGNTAFVAAHTAGLIVLPVIQVSPATVNSETNLSLTLPALQIPGSYTLSISNKENHFDLKGTVTFAPPGESQYIPKGQTLDEALRSKAIIVAGGGPGLAPDIWKETKLCADAAYKSLRWRGYTDDDIYYLASESDQKFPTDGIPSKSKLQYAVSTWATSGDTPSELLLYMVDHGGDGIFKVAPGEEVTVGELDGWLDSLQNTMPGQVIFIYDACKSGTFLSGPGGIPRFAPPEGKERIVITGTSDEDAYFLDNGRLSFSYQFWQAVEDGVKLNEAFFFGRNMIGKQTPLLDANGNGKANEAEDRSRAGRGLRRQYLKDSVKPRVENLSDSRKTLNGETSLNLKVRVNSENEITRVWAVVVPPDYGSEDSSAVTDLPVAELQDSDKDSIYETDYTGLGTAGTYIFSVYASDEKGYISLPAQMLVTQSKGNALSKTDSSEQSGDDTPGGAVPAVVNGGPVYHNFHEAGDTDYVKFYGLSGKTYQIRITSPSVICNAGIEIYGTDGLTKLTDAKDDYGAGEDEFLEWTCPGKGLYYARIGNADPDVFGANTNYRLEVGTPTGPDTGKILLSFTDSVSGNPVENARASFGDYSCVSGGDGNCEIITQVGTYPLLTDADGYESFSPLTVTVDKGSNNIVEKDIVLTPGKDIASLKGNIDGDGSVDLRDAILALQAAAGKINPLNIQADVNADGRLGIPEAIYIMRKLR